MRLIHIVALALCIYTPFAHTRGLIDEGYLEELIFKNIEKNNAALYAVVQRCMEKGAYTSVGTLAALCGCFLTASGIKRTFCEKGKVKNGLALTCCGIAAVFIGLNIASTIT